MKKLLFYTVFFFSSLSCFAQAYIPMPTDTAMWRYRIYDIDFITQVFDNILYLNGQDTFLNGNNYHKIMARECRQAGATGFNPPVITTEATSSDVFYGGMREAGKQVFLSTISGEILMYDFNAGVGDSIPAYVGKDKVTAIDSVFIGGVYHKRYLTTDPTFFVVEGVGSNRGLITDLNDGTGSVVFYCFTNTPVTWSPDTTLPCTYIYPLGYVSAVSNVNAGPGEINVYPNPANDVLHFSLAGNSSLCVALNCIGHEVWSGVVIDGSIIPVVFWPKGVYYLRFTSCNAAPLVKKVVID